MKKAFASAIVACLGVVSLSSISSTSLANDSAISEVSSLSSEGEISSSSLPSSEGEPSSSLSSSGEEPTSSDEGGDDTSSSDTELDSGYTFSSSVSGGPGGKGSIYWGLRDSDGVPVETPEKGDIVYISSVSYGYQLDTLAYKYNNGDKIEIQPSTNVDEEEWTITLGEKGEYEFIATLEVDENLTGLTNMLAEAVAGNWGLVFTPANLVTLITVVLFSVWTILNMAKDKKFKSTIISKFGSYIAQKFGFTDDSTIESVVDSAIKGNLQPALDEFAKLQKETDKKQDQANEYQSAMLQCLLYLQENTPEAREQVVKIIGGIQNLDAISAKIKEEVQSVLKAQEAQAQAAKDEISKKFDTLKSSVSTATSTDSTTTDATTDTKKDERPID